MTRIAPGVSLVLLVACAGQSPGGPSGGPVGPAGNGGEPDGDGAASNEPEPGPAPGEPEPSAPPAGFHVNPNLCSPGGGFRSAIRAETAMGPDSLAPFVEALKSKGYDAWIHEPESTLVPADASPGEGDASSEDVPAPGSDASPAPPDVAGDAAGDATIDAALDSGDPDEGPSEPDVADGSDVDPEPDPFAEVRYAIGFDFLQDAVLLFEDGSLVVASFCALDGLGQVRRLDFGLAAVSPLVDQIAEGGDYAVETARWAKPAAILGEEAGLYQRHYLNESLDLNKPHSGTLAFSRSPGGAAFGIYGHADTPSLVGDVVGVESLVVGGKPVATQEKQTTTGSAVPVWDLTEHAEKGEVPWSFDLLVADASVEWNVGVYFPFVEALFDPGDPAALVVSVQGALPGVTMLSKSLSELPLPDVTPSP